MDPADKEDVVVDMTFSNDDRDCAFEITSMSSRSSTLVP